MERTKLAATSLVALVLGVLLAPRAQSPAPGAPSAAEAAAPAPRLVIPRSTAALGAIATPILRPAPRPPPAALPAHEAAPTAREPEEPEGPADARHAGFISGHVVADDGRPIGGAILHLSGPSGSQAHRIAGDGEFHFAVPEGTWTVEAGWFDGSEEWRSVPATLRIGPGSNATLNLEVLLAGAGHAVRAGLTEAMGIGWEVLRDDGPLHQGDVLVEVNGRLLADMQPEAVHAALRDRPGETLRAVVLRPSGPRGDLAEVEVVLEVR